MTSTKFFFASIPSRFSLSTQTEIFSHPHSFTGVRISLILIEYLTETDGKTKLPENRLFQSEAVSRVPFPAGSLK